MKAETCFNDGVLAETICEAFTITSIQSFRNRTCDHSVLKSRREHQWWCKPWWEIAPPPRQNQKLTPPPSSLQTPSWLLCDATTSSSDNPHPPSIFNNQPQQPAAPPPPLAGAEAKQNQKVSEKSAKRRQAVSVPGTFRASRSRN